MVQKTNSPRRKIVNHFQFVFSQFFCFGTGGGNMFKVSLLFLLILLIPSKILNSGFEIRRARFSKPGPSPP